jgi:DNA (cytosine-5)-methyltransferase 1
MMRFGTMFSGGEGVGVGLTAAGLHHVWGVEFDADIAAVAADNGFAVHVADVRQVDYAALPAVDWLHASPVCTRASVANSGAVEAQEDIDTAAAVVRALKAQQPAVFTLENVWQYRTFKAFTTITDALGRMGYFWTYDHVNCADYGVPQTRKRLILRASRGLLPWLPEPVPWVGWYAAIEDLIPTLPESKLAPWQLARLPDELRETVLLDMHNATRDATVRGMGEPSRTQGASMSSRPSHQMAVLIDTGNTSRDATAIGADTPAMTIQSWHGRRPSQAPLCVTSRVVAMTTRCLARFQSVPDSYRLPAKRTLAARVIGNMVPPLLMQRVAEGMLGTVTA